MALAGVVSRARGAWAGFHHPGSTRHRRGESDAAPPPPPRGHRTGPPDFVGVGAMKAGTSWWYRLMVDHPAVADVAGRPKELHFFDRFFDRDLSDADAARYTEFFPRPEGRLAGEWTPRYMFDFWTPALVARAAPDAKVFVLLRDPVDRFRSGISHEVSRGAPLSLRLVNEQFARGDYLPQLRRLRAVIHPDRILVLQYEQCTTDTAVELARTYEFLGVDPTHRPPDTRTRVNPSRFPAPEFAQTTLHDMARSYRSDFAALADLCPHLDPDRWRSTVELAS